ncbi:MAG: hypothetical protein D6798_05825, partial [Deltaproteobacteria bacterium]
RGRGLIHPVAPPGGRLADAPPAGVVRSPAMSGGRAHGGGEDRGRAWWDRTDCMAWMHRWYRERGEPGPSSGGRARPSQGPGRTHRCASERFETDDRRWCGQIVGEPSFRGACVRRGANTFARLQLTLVPCAVEEGTRIGSLKIIRRMGAPGPAALYLVREMVGGGLRVLELFEPADPAERRRLLSEGMALTGLRHPNLASVLDIVELTDRIGVVREYVGGVSVRHEVMHRGMLPVSEAVDIVAGAAAGLARAHELGIVHGRLDASQVLLVHDFFRRLPKVVDVGMESMRCGRVEEWAAAGAGDLDPTLGPPGYVAPELVRGAEEPLPHADVFSLGAVLYLALTGVPPFRGPTLRQSLSNTLLGLLSPVRELRPDCPEPLAQVVERSLSVCVEDRPRSARGFLQALGKARAGEGATEDPDFGLGGDLGEPAGTDDPVEARPGGDAGGMKPK